MAVTQVYTAVANDVITAARWNNEFGNIYNNGTDISFPLTKAVSFAGYTVTLDNAGNSTFVSTGAIGLNLSAGAKTGTPGTTGANLNIAAATFTDSATAGSGTATSFAANAIQRPTLAASNASVTTTNAATLYIAGPPIAGTNDTITNTHSIWVASGAIKADGGILSPMFRSAIAGLTYTSGTDATNDININVGGCMDATNAYPLMLTTALGKQSDVAWAVGGTTGSPAGWLDTGAVGNSDYYIWLIARPDTGVVDSICSLSGTAPTMPANYTYKRLIGWFRRTGGAIVAFNVYETAGGGIQYLWSTPIQDLALVGQTFTSRRSDALSVPLAFSVIAHLNIELDDASAMAIYLCCPDVADLAGSLSAAPGATIYVAAGAFSAHQADVRTSATGTVSSRASASSTDTYRINTLGFTWDRR